MENNMPKTYELCIFYQDFDGVCSLHETEDKNDLDCDDEGNCCTMGEEPKIDSQCSYFLSMNESDDFRYSMNKRE